MHKQLQASDQLTVLKGRQIYFMILEYYATTESLELVYSIDHLTHLKLLGDNQVHTFRSTWDNILRHMKDTLAETSKRDMLLLAEDIAHYRRLSEGHEDKTYTWLLNCIQRALRRKAEKINWDGRAAIVQGTGALDAAPGQAMTKKEKKKAKAKAKSKAEAKNGKKDEEEPALSAPGATGKAKAKEKGKGKAKGNGKGRSSSTGEIKAKDCCYQCWFSHASISKAMKKQIPEPKSSRSPSPARSAKGGGKGKDKGKAKHQFKWCSHNLKPEGCKKGEQCPFPHLDAGAVSTVKKAMKASASSS